MKILHIDSSIAGEQSISAELTASIVKHLRNTHSDTELVYRDVCAPELPHHSSELIAFKIGQAKGEWTGDPKIQEKSELADTVLEEFLEADVVVIGAPMYNLSIPSQLKSWVDCVSVPGKTFRYTESGAQGLCKGKKILIASARGGIYSTPEATPFDHEERYLTSLFTFFGVDDIKIIRAEGVSINPEMKQEAMDKANAEIAQLTL